MNKKEILAAYLLEDKRVQQPPAAHNRVYSDEMYEVEIRIHPGIPDELAFVHDLVTAVVQYKEENLQITVKLFTEDAGKNYPQAIRNALKRLETEGKTPLYLVSRAKKWCNIPYTQRDIAAFIAAGFDA